MEYSALIRDFLDDAEGHLKTFDIALLLLEKNGYNGEVMNTVLGALHTLKGNSGMMGFESLKIYIHKIEEVLKKENDNGRDFGVILELLLDSANVLRTALHEIGNESGCNPDLAGHIHVIQQYLDGAGTGTGIMTVDATTYLGARTDTIKVDFKRLDDLLNLVGELVIFKTRLNQIETQLRGVVQDKTLVKELDSSLELMGKTISGLQEGIMKTRMLPVSYVFNKFPRMVRDISKAQDKKIRLVFEGEETELDKTVIDELEEPLLHILRNAVDHGIETSTERIAAGKDPQGVIILAASQESNYVIIRIRDDGRGIDLEKVREKAIQKGLIRAEDPVDRDALKALIFSAGFSTRQEATDISGRGIGLDVVHKNISKLNGQVTVDSMPGRGSVFTIRLPLSLAIIPALMAEAGGEVYAIPMNSVDESIKVRQEAIHVINNREVVRFRDRVVPVVRLDEFFGFKRSSLQRFYLVILGKSDKRIALAVDRLRGQQEIVIKPLDDTFGKSFGVAGASILGDGRIVLIADTTAFWHGREKLLGEQERVSKEQYTRQGGS